MAYIYYCTYAFALKAALLHITDNFVCGTCTNKIACLFSNSISLPRHLLLHTLHAMNMENSVSLEACFGYSPRPQSKRTIKLHPQFSGQHTPFN